MLAKRLILVLIAIESLFFVAISLLILGET